MLHGQKEKLIVSGPWTGEMGFQPSRVASCDQQTKPLGFHAIVMLVGACHVEVGHELRAPRNSPRESWSRALCLI